MLVVTLKDGQAAKVSETMVRVVGVKGKYVRLGFVGPDHVVREEILDAADNGRLAELRDKMDWEENQSI